MPSAADPGTAPPSHRTPVRVVVIGDSTAFTDATGPRPPDDPVLYPRVLADRLSAALDRTVDVTVVARPGVDVRDAVRTLHKDQHVRFDLVATADAVVVAVGSLDHAPAGTPPVLDAIVPHLRPAPVRRRVRRVLHDLNPVLVRLTRGRRRRTPRSEFERLFGRLLDEVRGLTLGRAVGVVLGPTSHRSRHHGGTHPRRAESEALHLEVARARGWTTVAAWPLVAPHAADLNPDGIHWPAAAHEAVGVALAGALLDGLRAREGGLRGPDDGRAGPAGPVSPR